MKSIIKACELIFTKGCLKLIEYDEDFVQLMIQGRFSEVDISMIAYQAQRSGDPLRFIEEFKHLSAQYDVRDVFDHMTSSSFTLPPSVTSVDIAHTSRNEEHARPSPIGFGYIQWSLIDDWKQEPVEEVLYEGVNINVVSPESVSIKDTFVNSDTVALVDTDHKMQLKVKQPLSFDHDQYYEVSLYKCGLKLMSIDIKIGLHCTKDDFYDICLTIMSNFIPSNEYIAYSNWTANIMIFNIINIMHTAIFHHAVENDVIYKIRKYRFRKLCNCCRVVQDTSLKRIIRDLSCGRFNVVPLGIACHFKLLNCFPRPFNMYNFHISCIY